MRPASRGELPLPTDIVTLPGHGPEGAMWSALLDLSDVATSGWTIIGALMVMLHSYEHGHPVVRATQDLDALVRVRGVTRATRTFAQTLEDLGWQLDEGAVKAGKFGFTFSRGNLRLDLLAPEGLGPRADLTTLEPLETTPIPGGSQALKRSDTIPVVVGERRGRLPRPDLLGALVLKACAAAGDRSNPDKDPDRHRHDLAVLYSLVPNPRQLAEAADGKDRARLGPIEPEWSAVRDRRRAQDGQLAHRIITGA